MSLKFSQIRSAFASQISTIAGFTLTRQLPEYFGRTRESIAHKSFSVGIGVTNQVDAERQRRSVGVYADSSVQVKFAYRLRPMDVYPTDYDLALDAEEQVINKCLSSYSAIRPEVQVRYLNSNRISSESTEYMIHTIDFQVLHTIGE